MRITNKDVIATIVGSEDITISDTTWKKVDLKTLQDERGNKTAAKINISNIDKTEPKVEVKYNVSSDGKSVTVQIKGNKELSKIDGWTLDSDKYTLEKTFTSNTSSTIKVTDLAENVTEVSFKVDQIKVSDNNDNSGNNSNNDSNQTSNQITGKVDPTTTTNTAIPKTGVVGIATGFIVILTVAGIVVYIRYKRIDK